MELLEAMKHVQRERKPQSTNANHIPLTDNRTAKYHFLTILDSICLTNSKGSRGLSINKELECLLPLIISHANNEIGKLDLNKGICIIGNCGSGKTNILNAYMKFRQFHKQNFLVTRCVDIANHFVDIDKYTNSIRGKMGIKTWTNKKDETDRGFDDLGSEEILVQNYGNKACVMADILEARHQCRLSARTFITSNLDMNDLCEDYGERIASRINELCNVVYLGASADSIDYRKI